MRDSFSFDFNFIITNYLRMIINDFMRATVRDYKRVGEQIWEPYYSSCMLTPCLLAVWPWAVSQPVASSVKCN